MNQRIAIDLFAGCGGLSLGLKKAGFHVAAAVEMDSVAAETYRKNLPETRLIERDIRQVSSAELLNACENKKVSLLAGCAPCQGFCSLTVKNDKVDPRNRLVLKMAELIEEIMPEAIFMENVPGLETRGKRIFSEFVNRLKRIGYACEWKTIQMADYGIPQSRRRLVLLAGRNVKILFPEKTHSKNPDENSKLKKWLTLRDIISHEPRPITLAEANKKGGPRKHNWNVVRNLQPQVAARLNAAIPGKTWLSIAESIRPKCHQNGYKGYSNTYGRMSWTQTPVTITGGCTTPGKGRFGHPNKSRTTISVREAALIQTFPRRFRFETDAMEAVCDMIGNAVPPMFAEIAAKAVLKSINRE